MTEGAEFGVEVRFGGGESGGGGDGSEGVWDADGAGVVEVSFFRREEAFVGVEGLARERWEGVVGDALGEASEGFEDGGVVKGLAEDAGVPACDVVGFAVVARFDGFDEAIRVEDDVGALGRLREGTWEFGFDVELVDDGVGGLVDGAEWGGGE